MRQLVVFQIGGRRFGIDLFVVERINRAVWITPLPHAPETIAGVINVHGEVVPVLNLRRLWQLDSNAPQQSFSVSPADQFIEVRLDERLIVLWVEAVEGVSEFKNGQWASFDEALAALSPARRFFEGAVKIGGEIVPVCAPTALLSPEDAEIIESLPSF